MHGPTTDICTITVREIEDRLDFWVAAKKITKEGDIYKIDCKKLGYNKLLATGLAKRKYYITIDSASKGAMETIKKAGGEVTVKKEE
jgi:ribosomal protein L15